jgi:hypothetical protein
MSNALTIAENKVPAHVASGAGRGNEEVGIDHLTMPRLKLLQKMSNEVDKHHPEFIPGAEDGQFMNSLTKELLGDTVYVINIKFKEEFMVWKGPQEGRWYARWFRH